MCYYFLEIIFKFSLFFCCSVSSSRSFLFSSAVFFSYESSSHLINVLWRLNLIFFFNLMVSLSAALLLFLQQCSPRSGPSDAS